jgi:hypothetical protein
MSVEVSEFRAAGSTQAMSTVIGEFDDDRESLRVSQPTALALNSAQGAQRIVTTLPHPVTKAGNLPREYPARCNVQRYLCAITLFDIADTVLPNVGLNPDIRGRDEGHQRLSCLGVMPLVDTHIRHHTQARRTEHGAFEV